MEKPHVEHVSLDLNNDYIHSSHLTFIIASSIEYFYHLTPAITSGQGKWAFVNGR